MMSYFQDGSHDVISRKVLPSGECTQSVRPAPAVTVCISNSVCMCDIIVSLYICAFSATLPDP